MGCGQQSRVHRSITLRRLHAQKIWERQFIIISRKHQWRIPTAGTTPSFFKFVTASCFIALLPTKGNPFAAANCCFSCSATISTFRDASDICATEAVHELRDRVLLFNSHEGLELSYEVCILDVVEAITRDCHQERGNREWYNQHMIRCLPRNQRMLVCFTHCSRREAILQLQLRSTVDFTILAGHVRSFKNVRRTT